MFQQHPIKVAVLVTTVYLSAHIVSSLAPLTVACTGGLTGVVPWEGDPAMCVVGDQQREQHTCRYKSCYRNNVKYVEMDTCRVTGSAPNSPDVSRQQCTDYVWAGDGTYTCTNSGGGVYDCYNLDIRNIPYITCHDCDPVQ